MALFLCCLGRFCVQAERVGRVTAAPKTVYFVILICYRLQAGDHVSIGFNRGDLVFGQLGSPQS